MVDKNSESVTTTKKRKFRERAGARPNLVRAPARHLRLHRCFDETEAAADCDVVILQSAHQRIMEHLKADTTREHGGLLLGHISKSENGTPSTIWISSSIPAQHTSGTRTSLTFTEDTWVSFERDTDALERHHVKLQRVGWYHSHPGIAIFLSHWDLDVCTNFNSPHHVALVVDPIKDRGGFFTRGVNGYRPQEPRGFWEFTDLKPHSMIEWNNTYEVPREWMIQAYEVFPAELVEPEEEVTELVEQQESDVAITESQLQPESILSEAKPEVPSAEEPLMASASEEVVPVPTPGADADGNMNSPGLMGIGRRLKVVKQRILRRFSIESSSR